MMHSFSIDWHVGCCVFIAHDAFRLHPVHMNACLCVSAHRSAPVVHCAVMVNLWLWPNLVRYVSVVMMAWMATNGAECCVTSSSPCNGMPVLFVSPYGLINASAS